jgi:peroxiredoxin
MSQLSIGSKAPDFELQDMGGHAHRLTHALERGPVLLAFYKSECPTSQLTFPYLQKIFSTVGPTAGWTLWGVSQNDTHETRRFANEYGIQFDLLVDDHPYPVSAAYGLEYVPALFLIQPEGNITLSEFGFTKAGLNQIAGFDFFTSNDGLPAARPG